MSSSFSNNKNFSQNGTSRAGRAPRKPAVRGGRSGIPRAPFVQNKTINQNRKPLLTQSGYTAQNLKNANSKPLISNFQLKHQKKINYKKNILVGDLRRPPYNRSDARHSFAYAKHSNNKFSSRPAHVGLSGRLPAGPRSRYKTPRFFKSPVADLRLRHFRPRGLLFKKYRRPAYGRKLLTKNSFLLSTYLTLIRRFVKKNTFKVFAEGRMKISSRHNAQSRG